MSFGRRDEGLYQCIASNSAGSIVSRPAALRLAGNIHVFSFVFLLNHVHV